MMIKILVQEQRREFTNSPLDDQTTHWETVVDLTAEDKTVMAGALRALANKYDPPEKTMR